jgi:tRNA (guanine-N(7)-)-methyltransferase subunit TRM82
VSLESAKLNALLKTGPIRCAAVDVEYTHLATIGDDKQLKVWAIDSLQLLSERYVPTCPCRFPFTTEHTRREIPKKSTQILFTLSGRTIVVADKFGDVFRCVVPALATLLSASLLMSPQLPARTAAYTYASSLAECGF